MELLQLRETEIFETLKKIRNLDFVIVGGYAVNAYTLPRFSVDCDIVIKGQEEREKIKEILENNGYFKTKQFSNIEKIDENKFERYQKVIANNFKVSVDVMIGEVLDRNTQAKFSAEWVFQNSQIRILRGKTVSDELKLRIVNSDALFVMKLSSCRLNDIRDLFLLAPLVKKKEWVKQEVASRYDLHERISKALKTINDPHFKNNLQGVFGFVDDKLFEHHKKIVQEFEK